MTPRSLSVTAVDLLQENEAKINQQVIKSLPLPAVQSQVSPSGESSPQQNRFFGFEAESSDLWIFGTETLVFEKFPFTIFPLIQKSRDQSDAGS